jgi:TolB-like protein
VLAALLGQPGRVFSRDDLQAKVWPRGVVVDFERGINKAINRLREALGDSAQHPRFIETLPKRGYRFIAAVQQRVQSIAVLPLDSLSPEDGCNYWANGLTDGLIHHLSRLRGFRVISRTSVMRLRSLQASVKEIGQQLNVETVLEGSVWISNGRIRARAQLVDVASDRSVWAETYDREIGGMLDVQDQIAQEVARRLHEELASPDASVSTRRRMPPAAHEAYLKGRYFWNQRTQAALVKSIGYVLSISTTRANSTRHALRPWPGSRTFTLLLAFWELAFPPRFFRELALPQKKRLPKIRICPMSTNRSPLCAATTIGSGPPRSGNSSWLCNSIPIPRSAINGMPACSPLPAATKKPSDKPFERAIWTRSRRC